MGSPSSGAFGGSMAVALEVELACSTHFVVEMVWQDTRTLVPVHACMPQVCGSMSRSMVRMGVLSDSLSSVSCCRLAATDMGLLGAEGDG